MIDWRDKSRSCPSTGNPGNFDLVATGDFLGPLRHRSTNPDVGYSCTTVTVLWCVRIECRNFDLCWRPHAASNLMDKRRVAVQASSSASMPGRRAACTLRLETLRKACEIIHAHGFGVPLFTLLPALEPEGAIAKLRNKSAVV